MPRERPSQLTTLGQQRVMDNLPLAYYLRNLHLRRHGERPAFDADDALSECFIGLIKSVPGFDPRRGRTFSTYAGRTMHLRMARERRFRERSTHAPLVGDITQSSTFQLPAPDRAVLDEHLAAALEELAARDSRMALIIRQRYLVPVKMTLNALAKKLGVCRERVRQLEVEALAWLREDEHLAELNRELA